MKPVRQIYNALMRAIKEGSVPFGYYGPETCRWATRTRCGALASKTVLWST
jgi:hypothetical protein